MIRIIVPGRPVPAVRMTQRSKYKSKQALRYLDYKEQVGWAAKACGVRQPMSGDLVVHAIAYLMPRTPEPDVDNLGKSMLDGLNGIAWVDDRQVMKLTVEKRWVLSAEEQKAVITIGSLEAAS
jgi:Holliday junction resolvase RusA-like endonuclease